MNLQNPRRNELTPVPFLNIALDFILSQINRIWLVEHDGDGHHTNITATSIDLGDAGSVDEDGNATFPGDTHTLGEFVFESGPSQTQEKLTIAGETDGWRIARKTASSPLNGTYALAIYDMASSAFPVLELGTISGVYHLLPHDSATVALGYNAGSSSDRFSSLTVQNGVYEGSSTVAMGYWADVPFSAGNYTASSGTWTVASGDVLFNRKSRTGNTLHWKQTVALTSVSNAAVNLRITLPDGLTALAQSNAPPALIRVNDNGAGVALGIATWTTGSSFITLSSAIGGGTFAISAAATSITFDIQIEVQ